TSWHRPDLRPGSGAHGGEKQRLNLTRSIYSERPYHFFDEPSAAMDKESEKMLKELIDSELEKTIVVVTHRLDLVMNFDIIYVLKDHKVAECGTHEELMRRNGVYSEMVRKQQGTESDVHVSR
ncbi:MAG: cysteine ABC transporter ATP-binding protein, partial [Bariatricus sp.]